MFLKQCDGTEFGWPGSVGLKKASLLSSSPNTSHLVGHRLDFDTSLAFRTALTFQKYCHRHGIVPLIWQDTILFTTTVTYGGGGGGEMGGKGGWFAFLLSSLFFFFFVTQSSIAIIHWINLAVTGIRCQNLALTVTLQCWHLVVPLAYSQAANFFFFFLMIKVLSYLGCLSASNSIICNIVILPWKIQEEDKNM